MNEQTRKAMRPTRLNELQKELNSLNQKFDMNMKTIEMLFKYSKGEYEFNEDNQPNISVKEAQTSRLKLINENFKINIRRIEIYKVIKNKHFEKINSSLERARKVEQYNHIDSWREQYQSEGDSLMIEILDKLKF